MDEEGSLSFGALPPGMPALFNIYGGSSSLFVLTPPRLYTPLPPSLLIQLEWRCHPQPQSLVIIGSSFYIFGSSATQLPLTPATLMPRVTHDLLLWVTPLIPTLPNHNLPSPRQVAPLRSFSSVALATAHPMTSF